MGMVAELIEVPESVFRNVMPKSSGASIDKSPKYEVITPEETSLKKFLIKLKLAKPSSKFEVRVSSPEYGKDYDRIIHNYFAKRAYPSAYVDKAWDLIHRCLNEGAREPLRKTEASKAIMGEAEYDSDVVMSVQTLTPECVNVVANLLPEFDEERIRKVYPKLDADTYCYSGDDEDIDYIMQGLNEMVPFYKNAAENGSAVLVVIC